MPAPLAVRSPLTFTVTSPPSALLANMPWPLDVMSLEEAIETAPVPEFSTWIASLPAPLAVRSPLALTVTSPPSALLANMPWPVDVLMAPEEVIETAPVPAFSTWIASLSLPLAVRVPFTFTVTLPPLLLLANMPWPLDALMRLPLDAWLKTIPPPPLCVSVKASPAATFMDAVGDTLTVRADELLELRVCV